MFRKQKPVPSVNPATAFTPAPSQNNLNVLPAANSQNDVDMPNEETLRVMFEEAMACVLYSFDIPLFF